MSLVLGPIHYKVYNNILLNDDIAKTVLKAAGCDCNLDIYEEDIEVGELQDLIGNDDIHGWLSKRVDRTEIRFAGVLKNCYGEYLSQKALDDVYMLGKRVGDSYPKNENLTEILMRIRFNTLDGMPCDGGLSVIENSDDVLIWKINMQVHPIYMGNYIEAYKFLEVRTAFLRGLLENTAYKFERLDKEKFRLTV